MVTSVNKPGAARSGASRQDAPDETSSPVPRLRWACAYPMPGVRYYRFLPDAPDTANVAGARETTEPARPSTGSGAEVPGGT